MMEKKDEDEDEDEKDRLLIWNLVEEDTSYSLMKTVCVLGLDVVVVAVVDVDDKKTVSGVVVVEDIQMKMKVPTKMGCSMMWNLMKMKMMSWMT